MTPTPELIEKVAVAAFGAMRGHEPRPQSWHLVSANTQAAWMNVARSALLAIPDLEPSGEEFLEFKEALADLRHLRAEYESLNGGGPGWSARNKAAWARVDELFANEDEEADQRRIEDHYG